jgi:hypothetical protein
MIEERVRGLSRHEPKTLADEQLRLDLGQRA